MVLKKNIQQKTEEKQGVLKQSAEISVWVYQCSSDEKVRHTIELQIGDQKASAVRTGRDKRVCARARRANPGPR